MANDSMLEAEDARGLDWFSMPSFYFRLASSSYNTTFDWGSISVWVSAFEINHLYLKESREKRHRLVLYVSTESRRNQSSIEMTEVYFDIDSEQVALLSQDSWRISLTLQHQYENRRESDMICLEWLNRRLSFTGSCFSSFLLIE